MVDLLWFLIIGCLMFSLIELVRLFLLVLSPRFQVFSIYHRVFRKVAGSLIVGGNAGQILPCIFSFSLCTEQLPFVSVQQVWVTSRDSVLLVIWICAREQWAGSSGHMEIIYLLGNNNLPLVILRHALVKILLLTILHLLIRGSF